MDISIPVLTPVVCFIPRGKAKLGPLPSLSLPPPFFQNGVWQGSKLQNAALVQLEYDLYAGVKLFCIYIYNHLLLSVANLLAK